ncbi:hypothetical protein ACE7GA_19255 [Roseomonas sp. CCTCC AB2023176]|uniref:hypothetical protein n=1 Tax=Roseomonas sp. CCTCC AB2023176 TaxID=3342640 RepID=UPI0035DF0A50
MVRLLAIGATLLLAACAVPEPPLLDVGNRACDRSPALETAQPVAFDRRPGAVARLGAEGRCIQAADSGAATTYAIFGLPQGTPAATVNILSVAQGTLVSPRVTLHDASGRVVRQIGPEDFRANVGGLTAGARLRGEERWLVVAADRAMLGRPVVLRLSAIPEGGVQVAAAVPIIIYVPPPTVPDVVRANDAVYALNGTVQVSVVPVPTVP